MNSIHVLVFDTSIRNFTLIALFDKLLELYIGLYIIRIGLNYSNE